MMAEIIALLIITLFTIILFVVSFAACADGYRVISCIGFMAVCIIMLLIGIGLNNPGDYGLCIGDSRDMVVEHIERLRDDVDRSDVELLIHYADVLELLNNLDCGEYE